VLHKMGYGSNAVRLPLVPLAEEYYSVLTDAAKSAGIKL